jgi:23S rRNA G2445 N2-methylase RlmL
MLQGALKLAAQSLQAAGVERLVQLHQGLCGEWQLPTPKQQQQQQPLMVVANPPWGLRLLSAGRGVAHVLGARG